MRDLLWMPQIPNADQYLQTTFDTMLRSHHIFFRMIEELRREEYEKQNGQFDFMISALVTFCQLLVPKADFRFHQSKTIVLSQQRVGQCHRTHYVLVDDGCEIVSEMKEKWKQFPPVPQGQVRGEWHYAIESEIGAYSFYDALLSLVML